MKDYKFDITWQTRCRGRISQIIEANSEEEARKILEDTLEIDFNNTLEKKLNDYFRKNNYRA